jgi:diguanylate cyclase (GGDEF)-like protein
LESIIAIGRDITSSKKHEEHVHRLVYYDYLTDLPNRDMLLENLNDFIEEALYTKNKLAVICIGLDEFKKLNDTFGHTRGDLILKAVSTRLNHLVGEKHKLYRIGGDEFAILIKDASKDDKIVRLLSKIEVIFNQAIVIEENNLYVSASMGIAIHGLHGFDANTLIANADTAMNTIKRKGIDNHAYFNESMKVDIYKNVQIENALRTSIINNELYLNFQPQIDAISGNIRGFEALLRWHNSELGYVPPDEFIMILESTHQIIEVGEWVLREACEFQARFSEKTGQNVIISVNISAVQLLQNNFVDGIKKVIEITGIKPSMLELEIT